MIGLKQEVLKRLEFGLILNEHNKILHVSHTDLDGYAPQIINKLMLKHSRNPLVNRGIEFMNVEPGELAKTFTDMIADESYKKYDVIIITDLSFKENDLLEIEKCKELTDRLVLVDHHSNLEYLNTREWAHVVDKTDYNDMHKFYDTLTLNTSSVSPISATELYTMYIECIYYSNMRCFQFMPIDAVISFARIVTLWDTWKWKTLESKELAEFARDWNRLFSWYKYHVNCIDILADIVVYVEDDDLFSREDAAIKGAIDSVKKREIDQFKKFKDGLKYTSAKMLDGTEVRIGYCYYKIADLSGACNYVFESEDNKADLIIAIRADNGLSYRVRHGFGLRADILANHVVQLCGVNAGGHPGAAGVSLTPTLIEEAMLYYIDSSLESIGLLQKDK